MHKRVDAAFMIAVSGVCAGVLWAFATHADSARLGSTSEASIPAAAALGEDHGTDATPDSRPGGQSGTAHRSMLASPTEQQSYSMSEPEFLSDPAAARARSIAVGDVSGDGRDDLVFLSMRSAPNPIDNRMEIYAAYQQGDGRLKAAVKIAESGNNLAYQLLIADLDGDGTGDIITATLNGVMLLRSNADGTFTSSTVVVGDPHDLVATDVDRDGYLDVLVDSSDTSATVLHGGRGGLERTSTLALPSAAVRTTGDVTGDGVHDLVLATIFSRPLQEFRVYPGLASGGYAAPVVLNRPMAANHTGSLAVGDFNADGRGDLVLDEAMDHADLHLYFQNAQGSLAPGPDIARRGGAGLLVASDLNRDGRTDMAIAHSGWGYVGYYLQTGSGFTPETVIDASQYLGRVNYFAAGDLNHDGCGDLVVSRWSQTPVLLYGRGCAKPPPIADCRYPADLVVEASRLDATGGAFPIMHQRNVDVGARVRGGLARDAGSRPRLIRDP